MNLNPLFSGVEKLYPQFDLKKIATKKVVIIGIGGVGSWCAEALIRSGIKKLTMIDLDEICVSNTNRQIHTTSETVGRPKVVAMKERLESINDQAEIRAIEEFVTADNLNFFEFEQYDLIIDAFDSPWGKAALAAHALERNIPQLICGAAGGKNVTTFVDHAPLHQTENDKLLKHVKKRLRVKHGLNEADFQKITAIFSRQRASVARDCDLEEYYLKPNCQGSLGSSMMVTASIGLTTAQVALEKLIDEC